MLPIIFPFAGPIAQSSSHGLFHQIFSETVWAIDVERRITISNLFEMVSLHFAKIIIIASFSTKKVLFLCLANRSA